MPLMSLCISFAMILETSADLYDNALKAFIVFVVNRSGIDMCKHRRALYDTEVQIFMKSTFSSL
jgi:hypothetical protein